MTPNPCNCETCDAEKTIYQFTIFCYRINEYVEKMGVKKTGCLSHPKARETLMAPVIAELERLYDEETQHSSSYSEGKADGYDRAISLIRGDGK